MQKHWLVLAIVGVLGLAVPVFAIDTILPNDDVFVDQTTAYDEYVGYNGISQVAMGLAGANGVASGRRRSFVEFTLGTTEVLPAYGGSAKFKIFNYWGANMGGIGNPAASATIRIRGTNVATPVTITEPAAGVADAAWPIPDDSTGWTTIVSSATGAVGAIGWHEFDITNWYNGRLGQTTCLLIRGSAVSGSDFPLFEDREGTAFNNHSDNTIANSGPRIEVVIPEPGALLLLGAGWLVLVGRRRTR